MLLIVKESTFRYLPTDFWFAGVVNSSITTHENLSHDRAGRLRRCEMVHEFIGGTYRQTNLTNESEDYRARREELRLAEIELMEHREKVAELRRALPRGAPLRSYEFLEGPTVLDAGDDPIRTVALSELFTAVSRPVVIYHLMYGKKQVKPCPMCTMWIDGANGAARHLAENIDFAVVAAASSRELRGHARARGWNNVRLLSAGSSTFKYDLGSEDADGGQDSSISVFTKDADGTVRHFYTAHPRMGPDIKERGIDLLTPVWNFMDLTPRGRGEWYASLTYGTKARV
jgi:predicted dithiol-disulfide oxidoreductase (DUF899 family)